MTPDRADLLARILSFDIDGGDVALPFAARLARENGWSRPYAERVIEEYKRYVFLAVTGSAPVCPSEDVDAAWHLHLTYTKSYWKRFCGELLNRPLHHEPTKGGSAEGEKHLKMYADTLTAYREAFGHSAPADIWPSGAERFGPDTQHRVVNTARNWVIPKVPVKRVAGLTAAFAVAAVLVPGCNGGVNPFELKNSEFLSLLIGSLVGAVIAGRLIRWSMNTPNPQPEDDTIELNWEQTAFLAGGAGRLTTAAVARLVGRGFARVDENTKTLFPSGPMPDDVSAVEKAVLYALPVANEVIALKSVQAAVEAAYASPAARLEQDGILLSKAEQTRVGVTALMPLGLVLLCLGLPRLINGLQGNHNVVFLVMTMGFGGLFCLVLILAGSLRLSKRGQAILAGQKARHEVLKQGTKWESNGDAGMAVALFGTAVLAGSAIAPLQTWYPRQTNEASSSGCSTGCGSGCGGGDGGGGGCGGGCGGGD